MHCRRKCPDRIADFAAGDGSLLISASKRWPGARLFAMDISSDAIQAIRRKLPHAEVVLQDFFDSSSIATPKFDLVLLNPPFTCRGSKTASTSVNGRTFRSSLALAFVARAVDYLEKDGQILALLPASCLTSEKDARLREYLMEERGMDCISEPVSRAFLGCDVQVQLVELSRSPRKRAVRLRHHRQRQNEEPTINVVVKRGGGGSWGRKVVRRHDPLCSHHFVEKWHGSF
ncbi:Methyltransferase small domain-containing protein [Pelagibacterium luteolum]|uniref:Methyltransferase small domain-containing protein n=2 Tax=Pelagibacterium luteolum TaxID=440168 RepID=A0A1G7Y6C0_9HYPH|nr:Methyltransferase small domain-containing protein [Pelagibacterium luteolum]